MNPELQGRVFPPVAPYLVGREKVREFSRAVLASNPINLDPEAARAAGHADVVAPPTFAVVVQEATLAQLLGEPDGGIDFTRVVHGITVAGSGFVFTVKVKQTRGHFGVTEAHEYTFHVLQSAPCPGALLTIGGSSLSRLGGCQ